MNLLDFDTIDALLQRPSVFIKQIIERLHARNRQGPIFSIDGIDLATASAVLFVLGRYPGKERFSGQPCVILNKRSVSVSQPGDLCCPGGRVSRRLDRFMATMLNLPILPLARWPYWTDWRNTRPQDAAWLRLLLATSLRESVEEMRLNPFGLKFLGPLPPQPLLMFRRVIYPMVVWVPRQKRFYPNWEVEKIIFIPLRDLLNPAHYGRYRLKIETPSTTEQVNNYPCFRYEKQNETELLWGATYRITTVFLDYVFGFKPPDFNSLPVIQGRLSKDYLSNRG